VVVEAALRRLGIESEVAVWHSAEWDPLGKPHPGAYLSTAAKLGVDPTGCLALEDSFNGAISAKAARMRVAVVPDPTSVASRRWGFCDAVLASLDGFDEGLVRSLEH
jgi:sugar-phosphatase